MPAGERGGQACQKAEELDLDPGTDRSHDQLGLDSDAGRWSSSLLHLISSYERKRQAIDCRVALPAVLETDAVVVPARRRGLDLHNHGRALDARLAYLLICHVATHLELPGKGRLGSTCSVRVKSATSERDKHADGRLCGTLCHPGKRTQENTPSMRVVVAGQH